MSRHFGLCNMMVLAALQAREHRVKERHEAFNYTNENALRITAQTAVDDLLRRVMGNRETAEAGDFASHLEACCRWCVNYLEAPLPEAL